jgi:serine/threonine protein kinase
VSLANIIDEKIKNKIRFTIQEITNFTSQLILGYLKMRDLGVIHQDIKPDNIMIGYDYFIKIIDFDVSFFKMSGVTFTGKKIFSAAGTNGYYSPEKLRCLVNRDVDAPELKYDPEYSDVFSLGLIFYQMITLREQIVYLRVSDLHNHIDQYTDIHQNIRTLVKRMLAENPDDRVNFAAASTMV